MKKQHGFILPLTVMIIFTISALIIRLMREITLATPSDTIMHEREQAKAAAMCGIDLMLTQLAHSKKDSASKKVFYERLYKHLNNWNTYTLHKETDGIDAELLIYVSCETGKIPINALWDFKNKKYVIKNQVDAKKLFEAVVLQKKDKDKSKNTPIAEGLEAFFKNQKESIDDITNLFIHESFQGLAHPIFTQPLPEKNNPSPFRPALGDLFTTAVHELAIQPLFLSKTTSEIFGLKSKDVLDDQKKEIFIKQLSEIKEPIDWSKQWNSLLEPLYDKKYESLTPALQQLLSPAIGAYVISVVCYGKVGMVTQKIRVELIQSSESNDQVTYKISKFYWL